jgi:hypothetical protein
MLAIVLMNMGLGNALYATEANKSLSMPMWGKAILAACAGGYLFYKLWVYKKADGTSNLADAIYRKNEQRMLPD